MYIADMHCDTIYELLLKKERGEPARLRENDLHVDLRRMKEAGYMLQNFALFVNREKWPHVTKRAEEMLALLKRKHPQRALTLVQADYFCHDFGEGRFDSAVSFETLHHFTSEKKTSLFSRLCRSLKPGGVYLECDYIARTQAIEDLVFAECARRRRRDGIPGDVFVHFDTPLTLEHEMDAMKQAGFSRVELVGFLPEDDHTPMIRAVK